MWTPPIPLFGMEFSDTVAYSAMAGMGAAECLLAYLVFQLRPSALFLGLGYFILQLASTVTSWALWDPWITEYTLRRRRFSGPAHPRWGNRIFTEHHSGNPGRSHYRLPSGFLVGTQTIEI